MYNPSRPVATHCFKLVHKQKMNSEENHFLNLNTNPNGLPFNSLQPNQNQQQFQGSPMMNQNMGMLGNPQMANFLRQQQQFARDANTMQDQNLMGMSPHLQNQFTMQQQQFSPNPQQIMMPNMLGNGMQPQDWRSSLNPADRFHVINQL